jgi:hypothetical protein
MMLSVPLTPTLALQITDASEAEGTARRGACDQNASSDSDHSGSESDDWVIPCAEKCR